MGTETACTGLPIRALSLNCAKQGVPEPQAASRDPIRAIPKSVWNTLDAHATDVQVNLERNDLSARGAIRVIDIGSGIFGSSAEHDFGNLGDRWQRNANRTGLGHAFHGKDCCGRLRF